jgi:hypothetical protein
MIRKDANMAAAVIIFKVGTTLETHKFYTDIDVGCTKAAYFLTQYFCRM